MIDKKLTDVKFVPVEMKIVSVSAKRAPNGQPATIQTLIVWEGESKGKIVRSECPVCAGMGVESIADLTCPTLGVQAPCGWCYDLTPSQQWRLVVKHG